MFEMILARTESRPSYYEWRIYLQDDSERLLDARSTQKSTRMLSHVCYHLMMNPHLKKLPSEHHYPPPPLVHPHHHSRLLFLV